MSISTPIKQALTDLDFLKQIVDDFNILVDSLHAILFDGKSDLLGLKEDEELIRIKRIVGKYYAKRD